MQRLALGTAQFGLNYGIANQSGQISKSEAKTMLDLAAFHGMDMLDTAIAYGDSEISLGAFDIRDFKVVTKFPPVPEECADIGAWIHEQLALSLTRLGMSAIYGLLLHRPEQLLGSNGTIIFQTLQDLKYDGKIKKVGISIYSPSILETTTKLFRFDLIQAPFNLIDRRLHNSGWLSRLKDDGVEIHARSVFLQGLLLIPQADRPPKFTEWDDLWEIWDIWIKEHNISAIQACLAFPLSFREIDRVIVGADNAIQLREIITAANGALLVDLPDLNSEAEKLINPYNWV